MKRFTVKQVSDLLCIPKDTLIYYDKLGIVIPERGENGYRHYTNKDIRELKYVEICKQNDFTLKEIKQSVEYQRYPTMEGYLWHRDYISKKKEQLYEKQKQIKAMINLLDVTESLMEQKLQSGNHDTGFLDGFLDKAFADIRRNGNEE